MELKMNGNMQDRRHEKRLNYHWPVWFAEDFTNDLSQGQMVDISSGGAAFTCLAEESPYPGQYITTRFSVPRYGQDNTFNMESHIRNGFVCRVDHINGYMRKIAIQFSQPLTFKPGEQENSEVCDFSKVDETELVATA
jgi:hypothetical protein